MNKSVFLILLMLLSVPSYGQNTFIPDDHFEQALIDLGLDDVMNDSVATENIDTLSYLHIAWKDIGDLTGIADFSSLTFLHVGSNHLTSLDISHNSELITLHCELNDLATLNLGNHPHLKDLFCRTNSLTSIDLSGLPVLYSLSLENNQLTQVDLSHNPLLNYLNVQGNLLSHLNTGSNPLLKGLICSETPITTLDLSLNSLLSNLLCFATQLTELDLSQNPALLFLHCNDIPTLQNLNLKNGNNTSLLSLFADNNPELFCIAVDTPSYSQLHWSNVDSWVSFQEDCMLGLDNPEENTFSLYPNPAVDWIYFSSSLSQISIRDISGRTLKAASESNQKIDVSSFPEGLYLLSGILENGKMVSFRFIRKFF